MNKVERIKAEYGKVAAMLLCVAATCWFSSCSDSEDFGDTVMPDASFAESRTVMVYMVAENDLSGAAKQDVVEMLSGVKNSKLHSGNRLVVYLDDVSLPRIYVMDRNTKAGRFSELIPVKTYENDVNSASDSALTLFIEEAKKLCPADSYGLVMWSHASGWTPSSFWADKRGQAASKTRSFGLDNGNDSPSLLPGNQMDVDKMADALSEHGPLDFILFDACFMQSIEVAYELRDAARHIIASPTEIPGPGAQYATMVPAMFKRERWAEEMLDAYYNMYAVLGNPYGIVISAVNTSALPAFSAYMKNVVSVHRDELQGFDSRALLNYYIYDEWASSSPDCFDMQGVMRRVLNEAEYAGWQLEAAKVLKCKHAGYWYSFQAKGEMPVTESQCCGMSMFVPREVYDSNDEGRYNEVFMNTGWARCVWGDE